VESDSDLWHFICDELTGQWMWRRVSASGEEVAHSVFSFASFIVCVSDAERAGFDPKTTTVRRMRSSELAAPPGMPPLERRRKPRDHGCEHVQ
jgi:hypothetical protein